MYHLLRTKITEIIIIFIIKRKEKKIPQMVYNISDWVTWGGMVLFSESILLMKIVIIEHKISFTKYEIFKKIKFSNGIQYQRPDHNGWKGNIFRKYFPDEKTVSIKYNISFTEDNHRKYNNFHY